MVCSQDPECSTSGAYGGHGPEEHMSWTGRAAQGRVLRGLPAMTSASTMVDRRCATTMVVRFFMSASSAFCTRCSLALSRALVACGRPPP